MKRSPLLWMVLVAAFGFESDLFSAQPGLRYDPVASTPYDSQIQRVQKVLAMKGRAGDKTPSLDQVNKWMSQLHAVRYEFSSHWKTPEELRATASGDCKAKCVALYYLMREKGAENLMLVIGRESVSSPGAHAWLLWRWGNRYFLLDPSDRDSALELHEFDADRYIPHYAYSANGKFRPEAIDG